MADDTKQPETPEERRKRRIEEARAKLKANEETAAAPPATLASQPESAEERRKRRIEEARAKLKAKEETAAAAPPAQEVSQPETAEERRKRRIEEARAKLKAKEETAAAAPPADETKQPETAEERRKRRIEEARAKLKAKDETAGAAAASPEAPPPESPPPAEPRPSVTRKAKAGVEVEDASADPLVRLLAERFPDAVESAIRMVGQRIVTIAKGALVDVLVALRDDERTRFDLLLDVTAVHRPEEDPPFEVVYQLCSTVTLERVRLKVRLADGASIPSAVPVWPTADWLERECFDMFGIVFDGHPDLRRILLPTGWEGHPLRKEYPVEFRENQWVRDNLNIVELPVDADFTGKFEV